MINASFVARTVQKTNGITTINKCEVLLLKTDMNNPKYVNMHCIFIFWPISHTFTLIYIYICMCVCVCVCIYIYIYIYTHTHTNNKASSFIRIHWVLKVDGIQISYSPFSLVGEVGEVSSAFCTRSDSMCQNTDLWKSYCEVERCLTNAGLSLCQAATCIPSIYVIMKQTVAYLILADVSASMVAVSESSRNEGSLRNETNHSPHKPPLLFQLPSPDTNSRIK